MRKEFVEHDQPLYRWKLTEDLRIIKSPPIYKYSRETWGYGLYAEDRYLFRIGDSSSINYIKVKDLDRVKRTVYISFTDDDEKVRQCFYEKFKYKVDKAEEELRCNEKVLEAFKAINF